MNSHKGFLVLAYRWKRVLLPWESLTGNSPNQKD